MKQHYTRKIKSITSLLIALLTIGTSLAQNVNVTATAGTAAATYATVSAAFAAINAGTHNGDITLSIVNDIIAEPASPVALGASGIGASNYATVTIVPVGNRIVQSASNVNRAVIELFGADNVTIDGDDPGTAGKQNLSILVSTGSFNNLCAAIHIGSVSPTNPATGIVVKNCIIKGPRLSNTQNLDNAGIVIGNGIATNIFGLGTNNSNIKIYNNDISRAYYGIFLLGTAGSNNKNIEIKSNKIGVTALIQETVGKWGIFTTASSLAGPGNNTIIDSNEIVVQVPTTTGLAGGSIGIYVDFNNPDLVIQNNHIHDIINNNATLSGTLPPSSNTVGIQVAGASNTNLNINNNIIRNVIAARKTTSLGADANYGIYMIQFGTGTRIHHNTIGLITTNSQGVTANALSCGVYLRKFGGGTMADFSNNIVTNNNSSTNGFCIVVDSNNLIAGATMNKNCYYAPTGTIGNLLGTNYNLNNWQVNTTKDLQSFVENPPFISATDLHIQAGKKTQLESNASLSILSLDIDKDSRPGPASSVNGWGTLPDIGADEFDGIGYIAPIITNVTHDPTIQTCGSSTPRVIDAAFSTNGNALDSVILEYSINGGPKITLKMNAAAAGFTKTIPSITPVNGIVQYRVYAMTSLGDTISSNYNYYNDNTATVALNPILTATPLQACPTSTISLKHLFLPDPTGFNFPPAVLSPTANVDITNVKLNYIINTTPINSLTGSIGNASGLVGEYSNFRAFTSDTFSLGNSYPISIESNATGPIKTFFSGFVDFNGDGDFNDAGENVFNTVQVKAVGGRTEKFNLYIPPNSRPGKTCLRVMCSSAPITNAFTNINLGEIEEYSIYIRPLTYTWMTGVTVIGTNNPQTYTVGTLPNLVYIDILDSASPTRCVSSTTALNIVQAPAAMNVTLSAPVRSCYNTVSTMKAIVTGGCPPYTYSWSNGAPNASSFDFILESDTLKVTVTVTDKNGSTYSANTKVDPNNPKLTTIPIDSQIICNRGTTRFTVVPKTGDSAYWYSSATAAPYSFDSVGRNYTTPTLSYSRDFYVAAFNSTTVFAGKINQSGTTGVTSPPAISLNTGLKFTTTEPIQIQSCQMYYTSAVGALMNIAILDKYGSILTQTGSFAPPASGSAAVATTVPLNLILTNPDTGYRIILMSATGITSISRNITGQVYPSNPTTFPMFVTGAYSIPLPSSNEYFYFYNFKILKGMCVGRKDTVHAKVKTPSVPAIKTDLAYKLLCKGDSLKLKIFTDTFGDRFVWTKNDIILPDYKTLPPSDTTKDSTFIVPISSPSDTGLYRVRLFSSKYCTRDTFSREVRVSFYLEPKVISSFPTTNICIGTDKTLVVNVENGYKYVWKKNGIPIDTNINDETHTITNSSIIADTGNYRVYVTDINNCRTDSSIFKRVNVFNHPTITLEPLDTVICENSRYTIYAKAANATNYQWFKDNGIMNSFIKDSIVLYNALISDSGQYRLIASSYPGCRDTMTRFTKLTVNPVPKIFGIYPPMIKYCEGQKIKLVSSTADRLKVEWFKNNIYTGTTNDSFIINSASLASAGKYHFVAKALNKCNDTKSDTTNISIVKKPLVSGFLPNILVCSGTEFKGGFGSTNGKMYQWYKNNTPLQGAIDSQLWIRYISMNDTGFYSVNVNSDSVCSDVSSIKFRINVQQAPVIVTQPVGITACMGENYQLFVDAKNTSGFQWSKDNANLTGANSNTYVVTNLSSAKEGKYVVEVKGKAPCPSIFSDTAKVYHRSGNTHAYASMISQYNATEQCTDVNNWTYYAPNDDQTKYIFAVKKKGNTFVGKADIVVRPGVYQNVNNSGKEYTATLMLQRFWNYKLESGDFTEPVDVKFYFNNKELDDLNLKVLEIKNLFNNELTLENTTAKWFKTDSLPFTNVLLNSILGNKFNFPILPFGVVITGTENNIPFVELRDVTNIGGGTAYYTFKGAPRVINSILNSGQAFTSTMSPIPNNGKFNLNVIAQKSGRMNLTVVNMLGQTVYSQEINLKGTNTDNSITIPTMSNGIYQLIMTKDDYSSTIKFQIEN